VTALVVVLGLAGWLTAVVVGVRLRRRHDDVERAAAAIARAEARAVEAEAMRHWLTGALDESRDAVVVVDRIGREVFRNDAAHRFDGRAREALAADALRELLHTALSGHPSERELHLYGPPRRALHLGGFPLRRSGEIVGAVGFTRDVTEARRVESVRRDFVANVSHELKTPIGALGVLAETMAAADDPSVLRPLAERVVREADRLGRIVDDLLDLSLIEAQEAPVREPLPAAVLVQEAVELVQAAADAAGVPLCVRPRPPDVAVACDHRQVRSALVNLLDNAIKYSGPGEPVEIGARVDGDRVALVVRDHGIGIPARDLERIFERFYRVDRARSRDTGGTGLGLAIVRHVAQAHGGEVTVESREGEGSTFTLYLPEAG
jgi:two-component system sensor histidine kinase SenX3